jgi:uncharacterized membrane protein
MNHLAATRWMSVLAFSLACLHCAPANAGSLKVCNEGDVTVKTALAETFNPFNTGTSFEVSGWYNVEPRKCSQLYDGGLANGLYVGFAYQTAGTRSEPISRRHLRKLTISCRCRTASAWRSGLRSTTRPDSRRLSRA